MGLFFKNGGESNALKMTITAGFYGAIIAGLFFILMGAINLGAFNLPIWIAITVFILMLGTQLPIFDYAPTAVIGNANMRWICFTRVYSSNGFIYGTNAEPISNCININNNW